MPIISVIIPLYNGSLVINRCLDSVFAQQSNFRIEVIVIDDGSTDNSVQLVEAYPQSITLLQQQNSGPAAARNKGIEAASGKYLAFLDADDYWEPKFILETCEFLENNPEVIAVSVGQIHKIPGKQDTIAPKILSEKDHSYHESIVLENFYEFWAEHNHVCTGSVLMKTDIVKQTGGQRKELRITEDLEFWGYLATFGKWGFVPKVLFISDGGALTRQTGWFEKNKKRWASAPTMQDWEKRIKSRFCDNPPWGYYQKQGHIAKNLAYAMILSKRSNLGRETVLHYKSNFPNDKLANVLKFAAKYRVTWFIILCSLYWRERFRKV